MSTPRVIERDYTDIIRQDSSIELRNKARAFWAQGEHLWDVDVQNNFMFLNWWLATTVVWCRLPHAPWNTPIGSFARRSPDYSLEYQAYSQAPFVGVKAYAQADYAYIAFDGNDWRPFCEVPLWKPRVEISIYVSASRLDQLTSVIVDRPFLVPADAPFSRCRGLAFGKDKRIFKNGQKVGHAFQSSVEGGVRFDRDTTFEHGDVLSLEGGLRNFSISILGKRL